MKPDNEKYNKVIDLLRNSKPSPGDTAGIERRSHRRGVIIAFAGVQFRRKHSIFFLAGFISDG